MLSNLLAGNLATTANVTTNFPIVGGIAVQTTNDETSAQTKIYIAGTLADFWVSILTNGVASASTITVRKNATDTALIISPTASQTGKLEDTTHTDTVAAGDLLNFQWIPGATVGTMTPNGFSVEYSNFTSGSMDTRLGYTNANGATTLTGASSNYYLPLNGQFTSTSGANTSETLAQSQMENACTISNLITNVLSNARTTTTTVTFRKNAANTTITVNYTSTQTGQKEDLTNTVSAVATDKLNYNILNGTGTSAITWTGLGCSCTISTSNGPTLWVSTDVVSSDTVATPGTKSVVVQGRCSPSAQTEANNQLKARGTYTMSDLNCNVNSNNIALASTMVLRDNAANTALTVSISGSSTGIFRDITHTYSVTSTSLLNHNIIAGSGGGGSTIFIGTITMLAESGISNILYSYTPSESAISVTQTLFKNVIHFLSESSISVAQTLVKKVTHFLSESSITASAATIVRKVIHPISEAAITVGASNLVRSAMHYNRPVAAEPAKSITATLVRKVIHPISETAISVTATLLKKVSHFISEPSISVTQTLLRKVIRPISEASITVTQTIKKKVSHFISEASITVVGTVARKVIRPITATTITVSQILTKLYRAIRIISEPSISVSSSSTVIRVNRTIVEPAKAISDSIVAESPVSHSMGEPTITITQTLFKKVTHFLAEPAKSISDTYTLYRVSRSMSAEPAKSITDSFTFLKVSHFISTNEPAKSISDSLSRFKLAVRSLTNTIVVGPSVLTKTSFNFRNLSNEPAINNILDSIDGHYRHPLLIFEPTTINISDSPVTASRKYVRAISEVPPIRVNDILNTGIIRAFEIHNFKQGRRFLQKRPEDTNLSLLDKHNL